MVLVTPKIAAKRAEPILFAHRGGAAAAPENTIEAFKLALEHGANGLESDVWVTADDVAVLAHDERFGRRSRRRRIADVTAAELPEHVPTLAGLFEAVGNDYELSLDIKDPAAIQATVDALHWANIEERSWLCHPNLDLLASWRQRSSDVRLVHSTRLAALTAGPERHAATLYERKIDAVNFRHDQWSGGLTALYHRFGLYCLAWDAQLERVATEMLDMGADAIFGDHVDRLICARNAIYL